MKHQFFPKEYKDAAHDVGALIAVNAVLAEGNVPDWVELIPVGPHVQGRDGRWWIFDAEGMASVLQSFAAAGMPLPIDWEHATEYRAPKGKDAPAAGWITRLEDRDGVLVGFVEWTPKAAAQIKAKEYRYLSPVFHFEKEARRIRHLLSAGLTNTPNLRLTAMNRAEVPNLEEQMDPKKLLAAACKRLGLDPDKVTEAELESALAALQSDVTTAKNRQMPDELITLLGLPKDSAAASVVSKVEEQLKLARAENRPQLPAGTTLSDLVPRADLELAVNRAKKAEGELAGIQAKALEEEIEAAVNQAIQDGKIAPASKEFYVATCKAEGGLVQFKEFAASAPKVIKDPVLPKDPAKAGGKSGLDDAELAVCRNLGLDPEEYAKSIKQEEC